MRSFLFVPGNRPERFAKALGCGADAIIIDLEDAVTPADKPAAREHVLQARLPLQGTVVYVRVNAWGTPWFEEDLVVLQRPEIHGIFLPKAGVAAQIDSVVARIGRKCPVIPIIETAAGLWNAHAVASAGGVERLAFGSIDFQLDLDCDGSDNTLLYARSQLALVSRLVGLQPPLDGITLQVDDKSRLEHDAAHAKALGFGGKLCIHPSQVGTINMVWHPTEHELAWAQRVLAACGQSSGNAVAVDGMMIDRPLSLKAQRIIELSSRGNTGTAR